MIKLIKKLVFWLIKIRFIWSPKKIKLGSKAKVYPKTSFGGYNSIGENTVFYGSMGHDSYIGKNSYIYAEIGNFCSIGDNVVTVIAKHPTRNFVSTSPVFFSTNRQTGRTFVEKNLFNETDFHKNTNVPLKIKHDVWIGSNVLFVGRITVFEGAIIGAGAVVTKDVQPFSIVGGVPAKEIRKRFSDDQINHLLKIQWWNKNDSWIKRNIETFSCINKMILRNLEK